MKHKSKLVSSNLTTSNDKFRITHIKRIQKTPTKEVKFTTLGIQSITNKHAKEVRKDHPRGKEKAIISIKITYKRNMEELDKELK